MINLGKDKNGKPRRIKVTDLIFWTLIVLLLIPQTRSFFLNGISKVRTAVFTPALQVTEGARLVEPDWNWQMQSIDGEPVPLSRFRGEVLLVNSWATWCPPCRAEMPSLEKLFQSHGDQVQMILVTNEEAGVVKEYLNKKGYQAPVFLARSAYPEAFSVRSLPTTWILDHSGQVVYQRSGAFDWNSIKVRNFLDRLVAEKGS